MVDYIKIERITFLKVGLRSIKAVIMLSACSYFFAMAFKILLGIQSDLYNFDMWDNSTSYKNSTSYESDHFTTVFELYDP